MHSGGNIKLACYECNGKRGSNTTWAWYGPNLSKKQIDQNIRDEVARRKRIAENKAAQKKANREIKLCRIPVVGG